MIAEIEERYNAELVETETFDPGPAFLGNHADIISVGTFEIAAIEEETGMMLRWRPAEQSAGVPAGSGRPPSEPPIGGPNGRENPSEERRR